MSSLLDSLKKNLEKSKNVQANERVAKNVIENRDIESARRVVNHIFEYVGICLRDDKSKVKLSLFATSFIQGILKDNVKDGINDFVSNMQDKELRMMLDAIQGDLNYRNMK